MCDLQLPCIKSSGVSSGNFSNGIMTQVTHSQRGPAFQNLSIHKGINFSFVEIVRLHAPNLEGTYLSGFTPPTHKQYRVKCPHLHILTIGIVSPTWLNNTIMFYIYHQKYCPYTNLSFFVSLFLLHHSPDRGVTRYLPCELQEQRLGPICIAAPYAHSPNVHRHHQTASIASGGNLQ